MADGSQITSGAPRAVVVGAGVGGLAAAILLARAGHEVTVLERADAPGGKMRAVPSVAGPVDAGPTVLTMRDVFEDLFARSGARLSDYVALTAEDILARHWWPDGATLDLHADHQASEAAVRDFAGPAAAAEFRAFSHRAQRLFDAFDAPVMRAAEPRLGALTSHVMKTPSLIPAMAPHLTMARQLAKSFSDPRLRQLFGRYATYVGGSPYEAPAILSLIWRAEAAGVWRVDGGMRRLAAALARRARELGARFEYGADVAEIEIEGGRAHAARTADGRRFCADLLVFNGDPNALATGRLGAGAARAVKPEGVAPRSLSAFVWSFAAAPSGPDLAHHNVFFGAAPRSEFDDLAAGRMPTDPTLYVCAEDRGAGIAPPRMERFEIIMNGAPVRPGAAEDPQEKDRCRTLTLETLARFGLTFSPSPDESALTTPSMFDDLFPASGGSLYGRSPHGLTAAFARPTARTPIKGLYLAGGGAHPGAGVPMATLSGLRAVETIEADLASTSPFRRTATRGGMSTGSATTA